MFGLVGARDLGPSKFIDDWDCEGAEPAAGGADRKMDGTKGRPGVVSRGGNTDMDGANGRPDVDGRGWTVGVCGGTSGRMWME